MSLTRSRLLLSLGSLAFGLLIAGRAPAEDEFDLSVAPGKVVVSTRGKWHINKEYPWRLVSDAGKVEKEKFELSEKSASVSAPKGHAKLRGGVCNGDQCRMFEKDVSVP